MTDIAELTATALRHAIARREISPREVLAATRARIERLNPHLNAFVEMCWPEAERAAAAAEALVMRGGTLPPLLGLPVGVKESTDIAGLHTTMGSLLYADRIVAEDAPAVAAIRAAGGVVIGKTNVPELLQGGTSQNAIYGLTRNAHDPALSCLGSSGGSAVALAAGMVPLATGSDMGGSIRGPASGNGIAGLRPSPGLIVRPTAALGFDVSSVNGPMARTTADVMLLLAGMMCSSPLDPFDWTVDPAPLLDPVPVDPATVRVAVSADLGCVAVAQDIKDRFAEVIAAIAPHVAHVEWVTPDLGDIVRAFYMLRTLAYLVQYGEVHRTAPEKLTPQKNVDLRRGMAASASMIAEAQRVQTQAFRALASLLQSYDVLITPGATQPLPSVEAVNRSEAALRANNVRFANDEYDFAVPPTANLNQVITWTAHPTATIPAGAGRDGLPFGLNLIGRYRDDVRLLRVALGIEAMLGAQPGFGRIVPDLSRYAP